LRFVRERAGWLTAKQSRAEEFSKHVATLLARRVLPDKVVFEAVQVLNEARARRARGEVGEGEDMERHVRGRATGGCCVRCGLPVPVVAMVVCANKVCFSLSLSLSFLVKVGI
jgi:hypothetical protein